MTPTNTWLVTWTTYGTRLPGDPRGFVTPIRLETGERIVLNRVGEVPVANMPGLVRYAESILKQEPVLLAPEQAGIVALQCRETATHRRWGLPALAVMANHVHLIVVAPDTVRRGKVLGDFKAYTKRRLDSRFGPRIWWTERGSARVVRDDEGVERATRYVLEQESPLVVWHDPR